MRVSQHSGELHRQAVQWPRIRPGFWEKSLVKEVCLLGGEATAAFLEAPGSIRLAGWGRHACPMSSELASLGQSQQLQPWLLHLLWIDRVSCQIPNPHSFQGT